MTTAPAQTASLIYEVRLTVDPAVTADFDTWLERHVQDMLSLPGFCQARTIHADPAPDGRDRRLIRYWLRDRASLDAYLERHAEAMRWDGIERFGDRFSAERDVYPAAAGRIPGGGHQCPECGTVLE